MICRRCIRLLSQPSPHSTALRTLTTTSKLLHPESPPPATSTSAAQPFSTPFTPSPAKTPGIPSSPSPTPGAAKKASARPPSSVPAGTPLRGLGYIKGQEGPLAKEDSEYPDWLWGLLDSKSNESEEGKAGDAFGKLHHSIAKRGWDWQSAARACHSIRSGARMKPAILHFLCHIDSRLTGGPHSQIKKTTPNRIQSRSRTQDRCHPARTESAAGRAVY